MFDHINEKLSNHFTQAKAVKANQLCSQPEIQKLAKKHLNTKYQKEIRLHNLTVFEQIKCFIHSHPNSPLILDSGCGTGMSAQFLALKHKSSCVLAFDQSAHRLNKLSTQTPNNLKVYRANCEDIWRLCVDARITFHRHYLLYPNPWPKHRHLKRRWHGHPVFPTLPKIANTTIVRSNWLQYLEEFNIAWQAITGNCGDIKQLTIQEPTTLFEKKYHQSGHPLYELECRNTSL